MIVYGPSINGLDAISLVTIGTANGLSIDANQVLTIALSSGSTTGALSSTDWNTFNNKQSALTLTNLTDVGTDGITITNGTGAVVGASPVTISQHVASASFNGYLSSTDWSTFNNKQSALTLGNFTDAGTDGITVTGGTGAVVGSGTSISQHVSDTTHNGYLSSTDWNTFNGKQSALSITNLTDAGTDGITITNGTGAVIGASPVTLSQHVADTTHNGYLSSTDWNTFNGKQAAGNYITALTGDATASGPGSVALTLATVNGNVGSFGSSSAVPSFTVNGKGLITAAGSSQLSLTAGVSGILPVANGGTNQSSYTDGQLLIGNTSGNTLTKATLTAGTNIAITNGNGSISVGITGVVAIANGGTNNGSLAVTAGGTLYTDGSKIVNVGAGSSGQFLKSNGASPPTWAAATATYTAPTVQKFTSSSGTYTTPTSPAPLYLKITMVGGGGGGGGTSGPGGTDGGDGTDTTFGSSFLTAGLGHKGLGSSGVTIGSGGLGGSATGNGTGNSVVGGAGGTMSQGTAIAGGGGFGAPSALGGGGSPGFTIGGAGATNTGAGGGGAGSLGGVSNPAGGGGSGGYVTAIVTSPSATYAYVVGAGGSGGTGTSAGGAGGSGVIIVEEHYQ